jgi:hypothetical protein
VSGTCDMAVSDHRAARAASPTGVRPQARWWSAPIQLPNMVRPDRRPLREQGGSCCIELAGASPVAVTAGAPRSRPRARGEIAASEWGVKSPPRVVRPVGGRQVRRPSIKRTVQPREIRTRKGILAEPLMSRRRRQTALGTTGATQDGCGVGRRACGQRSMRNRRDPSWRPTSGEGGPYKPSAKGDGAGRESEGPVVPRTPTTTTSVEGRGPALVMVA